MSRRDGVLVELSETPDVIAIIPTLGTRAARLTACLDSLRAQTGPQRLAVIVVVNGPAGLIDPIPDVTVVHAGINLGWAGGIAFGRTLGSAPLIWLVQDDMTPALDALDHLVTALRSDDDLALVAPVVVDDDGLVIPRSCGGIMNGAGEIVQWLPAAPVRPEQLDALPQLRELAYLPSRGMLVRLDDWDAVGGMDPGYYPVLWGDVALCRAVVDAGKRFALVPSALVKHPGNGSSTPAYAAFLHERNGERFRRLRADPDSDAPLDPRIPPDTLERVARAATQALAELAQRYSALSLTPHALVGVDAPPLPSDPSTDEPSDRAAESSRDLEFPRIYQRVVAFTESELARADPTTRETPTSEPVDTAMYSVLGVPESALLAIDDDRQFIVAAFAKLLDRLPSAADTDDIARRLEIRATTRRAVINQLLGSEEYRMMGARIEVRRE